MFDDGEGNIRTSLHGNGPKDGDYDNHNVTYSEKVSQNDRVKKLNNIFGYPRFFLMDPF